MRRLWIFNGIVVSLALFFLFGLMIRPGVVRSAITADGHTLAVATERGGGTSLAIWDLRTGQQIATVGLADNSPKALAFTRDGTTLAVAPYEISKKQSREQNRPTVIGAIKLLDATSGGTKGVWHEHENSVVALAFTPDNRTLVSGTWREVKLWDVVTREVRCSRQQPERLVSMVLSPDGRILAVGTDNGNIHLTDLDSGEELVTMRAHTIMTNCLAFSPDGRMIASIGILDGLVKLWDVKTGSEQAALPMPMDWLTSIAFSPDGRTLAVAGGWFHQTGAVKLIDVATREEHAMFRVRTNTVVWVLFPPDGKSLLGGSSMSPSLLARHLAGELHKWDLESGQEVPFPK